jgi:hypothetical protein
MSRYKIRRYRSIEEFESLELPKFDNVNDAIDDLMDTLFLDDVYNGRVDDDVSSHASELEWAT